MTTDRRRITLVARRRNATDRDWDESNPNRRIIFVDAFQFLRFAVERGVRETAQDIERVIIDRVGTPLQFLDVISGLPAEFAGDVLYIFDRKTAYLSTIGRGGDRVLYALTETDIDFYLETNGLVWPVWLSAPLNEAAAF